VGSGSLSRACFSLPFLPALRGCGHERTGRRRGAARLPWWFRPHRRERPKHVGVDRGQRALLGQPGPRIDQLLGSLAPGALGVGMTNAGERKPSFGAYRDAELKSD
jgi:hypothetical protein